MRTDLEPARFDKWTAKHLRRRQVSIPAMLQHAAIPASQDQEAAKVCGANLATSRTVKSMTCHSLLEPCAFLASAGHELGGPSRLRSGFGSSSSGCQTTAADEIMFSFAFLALLCGSGLVLQFWPVGSKGAWRVLRLAGLHVKHVAIFFLNFGGVLVAF